MDDAGLLQEYARRKSEAAFSALAARHVPLVFSASNIAFFIGSIAKGGKDNDLMSAK